MPRPNLFVLSQPRLNEAEAFSNLIEALKVAESSSKQIAFLRQQPDWLKIEFNIGTFRELCNKLYLDSVSSSVIRSHPALDA